VGGRQPPAPAKQRELDILEEYAKEVAAIFARHGRVMTAECEREQEELRRATRQELAEAARRR
jgi:hypothetical protein